LTFAVVLLAVAALTLLYVRQTGDVAATGYDVAALQRQRSNWQRQNDELRANVAQLESIERVSMAAQAKGLAPPRHQIYVHATPIARPPAPPAASEETPTPPSSPAFEQAHRVIGLP
jgi:hypothetical protein